MWRPKIHAPNCKNSVLLVMLIHWWTNNCVNSFTMNQLAMYRFKQLIFIALFLLGNAYSFGQCKQFNLNISYDKQVVHITPELTHNGVFSYKGIWYSDSIAVNQKSHLQNTNYTYKCLILKYDNIGHVVNHMNLILPTPNSTPNLRLDPSTGGLVYVISVDDK